MYALCPPDFTKIGNDCYYLSTKKESWLDAHFDCKDRNSKLAEPLKFADRRLRKYLKNRDQLIDDKWIGGMYNWQQMKWQWGYNGGDMKYQSFGNDEGSRSDLRYHCTTMDPKNDYMWSAKDCTESHLFICQHRMSYVNEKNRQKVYTKWNETYPNQLANEVEVYVSTNANGNRSQIRNISKRNRTTANRGIQLSNQTPKSETADNAPDYLPYSAYSNLEHMQKAQEDVIHPLRSPHAENTKQQSMKPRKRHSRPLKLTGEVNLGTNNLKSERRQRQRSRTVAKSVNTIDETVTDAGRHHHHNNIPNEIPALEAIAETSTDQMTTTTTTTTTEQSILETTQAPIEKSTISEAKAKLDEKAHRRERLRQKLAALTPEERQAFLLMKQQRADAKKKGLNYTH